MLASVEAWEGLAKVMCTLWGKGRGWPYLGESWPTATLSRGWLPPIGSALSGFHPSPLTLGFLHQPQAPPGAQRSQGQTKVPKLAPLSLADWSHRAEPVALSSSFCFVLLLFFFLFFLSILSSDQKIPESSLPLTLPETLQLKTA